MKIYRKKAKSTEFILKIYIFIKENSVGRFVAKEGVEHMFACMTQKSALKFMTCLFLR